MTEGWEVIHAQPENPARSQPVSGPRVRSPQTQPRVFMAGEGKVGGEPYRSGQDAGQKNPPLGMDLEWLFTSRPAS